MYRYMHACMYVQDAGMQSDLRGRAGHARLAAAGCARAQVMRHTVFDDELLELVHEDAPL